MKDEPIGGWDAVGKCEERIAQLERELAEAKATWRCFNCGFETADQKEAIGHFGDRDDEGPLCLLWKDLDADGKASQFQDTYGQLQEEFDENCKLRNRIEGLEYARHLNEADLASRFSMEGRALAAEEQRDTFKRLAGELAEALEEIECGDGQCHNDYGGCGRECATFARKALDAYEAATKQEQPR